MKMIYPKLNKNLKVILLIYVSLKALICSDCHFDVDICKWSNDDHSDFYWTRQNGKTPSEFTGPDGDHTSGDGHYIFIESSLPRIPGEIARLLSPMQASGHACLVFWYSMYGQGIGSLNIYMKTVTPNDILIFSRNNSFDNNIWLKAAVSLISPDDYQIVIEGIVGKGLKGDIAIDDIILENETCSAVSDGYYMYIETSHPRVDGEVARLISPIQGNGQYCLTFWYSMFGQHVNKLSVYVKTEPYLEAIIFSKENGTDDMNWIKAELSFTSVYEFEIVIEGIAGKGIEGDIAIDDIVLENGTCSAVVRTISFDCNFDVGFCNWKPVVHKNSELLWGRQNSSSSNTGPNSDHTSGVGNFIYINSSNELANKRARLSTTWKSPGMYCLSFWYYSYGRDTDILRVAVKEDKAPLKLLFLMSNNQRKRWIFQKEEFLTVTTFEIFIDGIIGNDTHDFGYIAVDDVKMFSEECPKHCSDPTPAFGKAVVEDVLEGSIVNIACKEGYEVKGSSFIVCQNNGE